MPRANFICNLPDELLLKIVLHIPSPRPDPKASPHLSWGVQRLPLSDYRNLALVCRRLNRVVTGVLYAHYDHESDYMSSVRFIETLFRKPHLALHLKSLKELGPAVIDPDQPVAPYKRSASSIECLCAVFRQLYPTDEDSLQVNMQPQLPRSALDLFKSGDDTMYDLEAALILALAPNIQTVALNWDHGIGHRTTWFMEPPPICLWMMTPENYAFPRNRHLFQNLRRLKVNMTCIRFCDISGVLRLPSLAHLVLFKYRKSHDSFDLPTDTEWKCLPKESKVQTIRLDDCDVHEAYLVKLILSCQHLQAFALSVSDLVDDPIDYSQLISELQDRQPALEVLSVSCPRAHHAPTGLNRIPSQFGSLRGFQSLAYLAAPLELLVNPLVSDPSLHLGNLLPRSLRSFVLAKGEALHGSNLEEHFDRVFCDGQVQSVVDACQYDNLQLQTFGINYATDFRYQDAPGGYANTSKDLARMEDVHFDFFKFARDFELRGVHFDYVIKVHHDRTYEAHERLISVRRINGDAIAEEFSYHLYSTCDPVPKYTLTGLEQPLFMDTEGEEWKVHRNKIPYELREEL